MSQSSQGPMNDKTLFSKIIDGEIPGDFVHRDDQCVVIRLDLREELAAGGLLVGVDVDDALEVFGVPDDVGREEDQQIGLPQVLALRQQVDHGVKWTSTATRITKRIEKPRLAFLTLSFK